MSYFLIGLVVGALGAGVVARWAFKTQSARIRSAERRARSAERLAELGAMTGGLAHEIKNPLATIGLNAQLLSEGIEELSITEEEKALFENSQTESEIAAREFISELLLEHEKGWEYSGTLKDGFIPGDIVHERIKNLINRLGLSRVTIPRVLKEIKARGFLTGNSKQIRNVWGTVKGKERLYCYEIGKEGKKLIQEITETEPDNGDGFPF